MILDRDSMMTDTEMRRAVMAMVEEYGTRPDPPIEDKEKLSMMAVVSVNIVQLTGPIMGTERICSANLAIIRTAYELGKAHGGLVLTVAPEEA